MQKSLRQPYLVSIAVPVYNLDAHLPRCIESLVSQTYKNLEILLIDNAATKACLSICEQYAKQDKRVKIIHLSENVGPTGARAAGITHAIGDFIGFCDSDDWFELDAVETLLNLYAQTGAEIVQGGVTYYRENGTPLTVIPFTANTNLLHLNPEMFLNASYLYCWDKLYARRLLEAGLQFDKTVTLAEDVDFAFHAIQLANFAAFTPKNVYNYLLRKNSVSHTPDVSRFIDVARIHKQFYEFFQKHQFKTLGTIKGRYYAAQCVLLMTILLYDKSRKFDNALQKVLTELRQHLKEIFIYREMGIAGKIFILFPLFLPDLARKCFHLSCLYPVLHKQYMKRVYPLTTAQTN